jgi:hypothetical protein
VLQASWHPGGEEGPATGQAKQGTASSGNTKDKRYRTGKTRYTISGGRIPRLGERVECCRLHGIQEERSNEQDKRYRTSRVQLQDSQNKVQDQQTMHRTRSVHLQDRQNKVQVQAMHRTGKVKVQDKQGPATGQAKQGTGSSSSIIY